MRELRWRRTLMVVRLLRWLLAFLAAIGTFAAVAAAIILAVFFVTALALRAPGMVDAHMYGGLGIALFAGVPLGVICGFLAGVWVFDRVRRRQRPDFGSM